MSLSGDTQALSLADLDLNRLKEKALGVCTPGNEWFFAIRYMLRQI